MASNQETCWPVANFFPNWFDSNAPAQLEFEGSRIPQKAKTASEKGLENSMRFAWIRGFGDDDRALLLWFSACAVTLIWFLMAKRVHEVWKGSNVSFFLVLLVWFLLVFVVFFYGKICFFLVMLWWSRYLFWWISSGFCVWLIV